MRSLMFPCTSRDWLRELAWWTNGERVGNNAVMRACAVAVVLTSLTVFAASEPGAQPSPPPTPENQPRVIAPPKVRPPRLKQGARFVQRRLARPSAGEGTPLVFSWTEAVELNAPSVPFAFLPGQPRHSAWPDLFTPWLVRVNGYSVTGRELFGSFTLKRDGSRARNGFEALAELDADRDGVVGPSDPGFPTLSWWFDFNGDRQLDPGELQHVETPLPTNFTVRTTCDREGNCVKERARLPSGGWLLDLHLQLSAPDRT